MYLLVYLLRIMPFWTSILQIFVVQSQFKFWPEFFEFNLFFFTVALILLHTNKWMKIGIKDNIVSSIVVSTTQLLHCRRVYNAELEMYV